jgi:primosomal protein N' (replication factor Y) (superfamily II helicase)
MTPKEKFIQVALDVPMDQLFDYLPNDQTLAIGQYVKVPFGSRQIVGIICGFSTTTEVPIAKLRKIILADEEIIFDKPLFKLLNFVSRYYHYPLGQTIMSVVPSRIKRSQGQHRKVEQLFEAGNKLTSEWIESLPKRQVRLKKLASNLLLKSLRTSELNTVVSNGRACIQELVTLGLVNIKKWEPEIILQNSTPPKLNNEQQAALSAVAKTRNNIAWLIHGITGSGKTEIYLQLLAEFVPTQKEQVLILVPEINLTPQLEARFKQRFPDKVLVTLHSHLTDIERLDHWRRAKSGEAQIVIGTRLAVFTPMPHLTLIIIDEEHDGSFKQHEGLRYHARDVAMMRAKYENIPIVLGTATPALETWFNAQGDNSKYHYLKLSSRAVKNAKLPIIHTIPMTDKYGPAISSTIVKAIQSRLDRQEQSLIFINRRGYSPVLVCSSCSWSAQCGRCSARLVVHLKTKRLKCHHCGYDQKIPMQCLECGNTDLHPVGLGTQKIEESLNHFFPKSNILRVDRDTTRTKEALNQLYQKMNHREIDILVGTQMLAKGHDFPHLTLVVAIDADNALYSSDFRAPERLFSQLMQVAGRAGRSEIKGEVLIQTAFPYHPVYEALKANNFEGFADSLLEERKQMQLSPFSFNALLQVEAKSLHHANEFSRMAVEKANEIGSLVTVYGPVRPLMERLKGFERYQIFLQAKTRPALHNLLSPWVMILRNHPLANRVKWSIDVDPIEF